MTEIIPKETRSRGIYLLPNLFTIGAMFAGFYAIVATLKGIYETAAVAIFVAMLLDSLDGRVARLTNTMTAFGAELDSLSDMVCFAIAPALLVYSWSIMSLGKIGWLSAFVYAVAVALRLARFNTQIQHTDKRFFQGLPCPAAAAVLTSMVWCALNFDISPESIAIGLAVVTIAMGLLQVSNIRYRSFKDTDFKNHVPFVVILLTVLIIVLISVDPAKVLFAVFASYAISGPIATIWGLHKKKKARAKTAKSEKIGDK